MNLWKLTLHKLLLIYQSVPICMYGWLQVQHVWLWSLILACLWKIFTLTGNRLHPWTALPVLVKQQSHCMVVMDRVNANLGLENSGRWSLYTGGLYIQLNYSEKCIGRTQRRSLYAGGLFMQVVFSTGSTVLVTFTNNAKIIQRVNIIRITLNNPKLMLLMKITRTCSGWY